MALQAPSGQSTLCHSASSRKTRLKALQLAVGQHLSQFTPSRATMTCPSKSQAWCAHLCHPQEARWRDQHAIFHASSVQSNSEARAALSTRVFCVCSHFPVEKSREQLSIIHRVILGGEGKRVCGRSLNG